MLKRITMNTRISFIIAISTLLLIPNGHSETTANNPECVILLHGLARTENSLTKLENHLEKEGYLVVNTGYPSREKNIQELSVDTIPNALAMCEELHAQKIHFVTHSMGAILVRYYLAHNKVSNLGRIVMISPPNNGSEIVDKFRHTLIFKWLSGPAGEQLGTDINNLPKILVPPECETGIIAGDRSINPFLSLIIPGKDDGKVSVKSAKLPGMKDFLIVHDTHTFIMNDKKVLEQVTFFLENGIFRREENSN
jgi:triacylglycerol lipase